MKRKAAYGDHVGHVLTVQSTYVFQGASLRLNTLVVACVDSPSTGVVAISAKLLATVRSKSMIYTHTHATRISSLMVISNQKKIVILAPNQFY